jgi:hypothetical protein
LRCFTVGYSFPALWFVKAVHWDGRRQGWRVARRFARRLGPDITTLMVLSIDAALTLSIAA